MGCGVEIGDRTFQLGLLGGRFIKIGRLELAARLLFAAAVEIMSVLAIAITLMAIAPPAAPAAAAPPPFAILFAARLTMLLALAL